MNDEFHPFCALFPLIEGPEFDRLVNDVRKRGVIEPIWRDSSGRIIDGRNRWRAAQEAGVDCPSRAISAD